MPTASRDALDRAEIVFGGPRHLALAGLARDTGARGWPGPFDLGAREALCGASMRQDGVPAVAGQRPGERVAS